MPPTQNPLHQVLSWIHIHLFQVLSWIYHHLVLVSVWTFILGFLIYGLVKHGTKWRQFINEVALELSKCSWPWNPQEKGFKRYKELIDSTVVVAVSALMLAGIVTSSDFILQKVVNFLTTRLHI